MWSNVTSARLRKPRAGSCRRNRRSICPRSRMSIRRPVRPHGSDSKSWATAGESDSPRSPEKFSMSEAGTPKEAKQPKAPKQGAGPPESKAAKKKEAAQTKGKGPPVGETARDPNYVPRYKKHYLDAVRPELMKKFGYTNKLQAPRIE